MTINPEIKSFSIENKNGIMIETFNWGIKSISLNNTTIYVTDVKLSAYADIVFSLNLKDAILAAEEICRKEARTYLRDCPGKRNALRLAKDYKQLASNFI